MSNQNVIISIDHLDLFIPINNGKTSLRDCFVKLFTRNQSLKRKHVLKNINLKILENDRLGILATNGSGKSTLAKCLSQIYTPQSGSITSKYKVLPILDSNLDLYPELNGNENMQILCDLFLELDKSNREKLISDAAQFSELGADLNKPVKSYSKGMLARLTLSLLTAMLPEVLIIDEIGDGLDEFFYQKLLNRIDMQIEKAKAVIYISHDEHQIKTRCNRAIVLHEGQIVFDGSPIMAVDFYRQINM